MFLALFGRFQGGPCAALEPPAVVAPGQILTVTLDPGSVLEAAWDGGLLQAVDGPLVAPASGLHWLALAARDDLGQLSELTWIRVQVDDEAPEVLLGTSPEAVAAGGHTWLPGAALVEARAVDRLSPVVAVRLDSGDGPVEKAAAEASLALEGRGAATVIAEAEDRAGNRGRAVLELELDPDPPTIALSFAGPTVEWEGGTVVAPTTTLESQVTDAGSGTAEVVLLVDGEEVSEGAWRSGWREGRRTAALEAVDRVGNRGLAERVFVVDATPPGISWSAAPGPAGCGEVRVAPVMVTVEASDPGSGVSSLEWAPGGSAEAPWQPVSGPLRVDGPALLLRSADGVGNAGTVEARWALDTEPPRLALVDPEGRHHPAGETVRLHQGQSVAFEASDDGCGVTERSLAVGLVGWQPLPERKTFSLQGWFHLRAEVVDGAGRRTRAWWVVRVLPAEDGP